MGTKLEQSGNKNPKETISSLPFWPKLAVLKPSPVYPYNLCGRLEAISSLSLEPFLVHVGCLETISSLSLEPFWPNLQSIRGAFLTQVGCLWSRFGPSACLEAISSLSGNHL